MNLNEYKKRAFDVDPGLYDEYRALATEYEMINKAESDSRGIGGQDRHQAEQHQPPGKRPL
jgi:hypothetical protein